MTPDPRSERTQYGYDLEPHFYDRTLDGMTVPLVVVDEAGTITYGNFAAVDLTGWPLDEALGRNMLDFVSPDDHQFITETFLNLVEMDEGQTMLGSAIWSATRFRLLTKHGVTIPVEVEGKVAISDGAVNGIALTIKDLRIETVGKRIMHGIAEGDEIEPLIRELTEAIPLPPAELQAAVYRSHGRSEFELVHSTHPALADLPLDDDRVGAVVPPLGTVTKMPTSELPVIGSRLQDEGFEEFLHLGVTAPDQAVTYRFVAVSPTYLAAGRAGLHRLEWAQELTSLLLIYDRANRLLVQQAIIDPLTGLRNRRGLSEFLEALPPDEPCLVLFVDLDAFKAVNDEYGHRVGDRTLEIVANRLLRAVRLDDVICRFGGDEFGVILSRYDCSTTIAETVADRIVSALEQPIVIDEKPISLSASVGIAQTRTPLDPDRFFEGADRAMYQAKRSGGGRYAIAAGEGFSEP